MSRLQTLCATAGEGVDETKTHDNIIEDNANLSDEDESVISSKYGESAEWHNTTIWTWFPSYIFYVYCDNL